MGLIFHTFMYNVHNIFTTTFVKFLIINITEEHSSNYHSLSTLGACKITDNSH